MRVSRYRAGGLAPVVHFLTGVIGGHVLGLALVGGGAGCLRGLAQRPEWVARTHPLEEGLDPEAAGLRRARPGAG